MRLTLHVPSVEVFNEVTSTFINTPEMDLTFLHSLVSISKWESKHHKPLLKKDEKTAEEVLDYIKTMTLTKNVPEMVYDYGLTPEHMGAIAEYMSNPMTATTFHKEDLEDENTKPKVKIITSEVIYSWMIAYRIPKECEKWHINRLLTLIRVCEFNNAPTKQVDTKAANKRNARLNAQRRAQYNTKG